jgi:hypothetical protein
MKKSFRNSALPCQFGCRVRIHAIASPLGRHGHMGSFGNFQCVKISIGLVAPVLWRRNGCITQSRKVAEISAPICRLGSFGNFLVRIFTLGSSVSIPKVGSFRKDVCGDVLSGFSDSRFNESLI